MFIDTVVVSILSAVAGSSVMMRQELGLTGVKWLPGYFCES